MCLHWMKARADNNEYHSLQQFMLDAEKIYKASLAYNGIEARIPDGMVL